MKIQLMQEYKLVKDNQLITIDEKGKFIHFKSGKICKVHNIENNVVTAYWNGDIWKPIVISLDEFNELFELIKN